MQVGLLIFSSKSTSRPVRLLLSRAACRYRRHIARILYVFAESNPGLSYVQGMHDVVCVIFHVFFLSMEQAKLEASSTNEAQSPHTTGLPSTWKCMSLTDVEADTYAAFSHLMIQMRTLLPSNYRGEFCSRCARADCGVRAVCQRLLTKQAVIIMHHGRPPTTLAPH